MTMADLAVTPRRRDAVRRHVGLIVMVVLLGLPTRLFPQYMPDFMVYYGGDVLWALMIFLLFGLLFPTAKQRHVVLLTLAVTWGIEFSQLIHADWLEAIRSPKLGRLIFGYTFLWSDLVCYGCGIGAGVLLERNFLLKPHQIERIGHEN